MVEERKKGNELWRIWIEENRALFTELKPTVGIGFMVKEIFENLEGKALILKRKEAKKILFEEVEFTGLRALTVDVIFIATASTLEKLINGENNNSFYQLIRKREVLFFTLVGAPDLEEKGYTQFLESIGLGFLGTCVG